MHREESDRLVQCADCGSTLDVDHERGFARGALVLCWACALARGGRYDEDEDRWTLDPESDALEVDPHRVR